MTSDASNRVRGRWAEIFQRGVPAGVLEEQAGGGWGFRYLEGYSGPPVSLTMPVAERSFQFEEFPAIFEGLLPEGPQLEALLRTHKIDRNDAFRQLVTVGADVVGSLTVAEGADDHQKEKE
ncbi:MAG: toxin HipA [Verrucomicrobia bacterium]|nr:MAG: toxin HipA [Verrucomicrobiota bacterium]